MKIYQSAQGIIIESESGFFKSKVNDWNTLVNSDNLFQKLKEDVSNSEKIDWTPKDIAAPIGTQEIWAAGVTYFRSREARMEESKESGAAVFYSKVYEAERPELFFKSTYYRVAQPNGKVHIRKDSKWNVPEPELTLFINSSGHIAGYTIGNDMSSRDIEGENPLYLPQAKSYDFAAAIGPCLFVPEKPIHPDTKIHMKIERYGKTVFEGEISINQMKRSHSELAGYLFREMAFPDGVYLMTGTCLVPDDSFTLHDGDKISIEIDEIGTLVNIVGR
ncbi:fumarylacetoacetate hydrolase family protein [Aquiflexum sp. LQ15W]|uniref:fumarylacetoacetate hydrolase family protein n=1 Tax=Cognataquiflexum nitidum TaxID=2922272 RepID=UPI001F12D699|nr:fumarylacetoacetate hydrolase family protein [Cognataquiflexum nitidum]MCH6198377.1 fumarylacetoacetate hydrolase family protein [Cognataquiflexum nitidum]